MPLTQNGKIDRKKLPSPETEVVQQEYVGPRNPTEETLCRIWQEVLRRERVGIHDNFFALGGHSLLAAQVAARMRESFEMEVPLLHLFELPTIARLSAGIDEALQIAKARGAREHLLPSIQRVARPEQGEISFPASYAQQRLWFLDQLMPGKATYNIPGALRIAGELDVKVLKRTLQEVVDRHETLRTYFRVTGSEAWQVIEKQVEVELPVVDLTAVAREQEKEAEALHLAQVEVQEPFNLQQAPMFRARLLRLAARDHVLLFTMHHIISDAWSTGVLIAEVTALYEAFSAGKSSPLPELEIQYADYTMWQREWMEGGGLDEQIGYWEKQLAGVSMLQLPTDHPRPLAQSEKGAAVEFAVPAELVEKLKKLGEEQGMTLFMVLLGAFQILLSRYSGQNDITVGTPVAGRSRRETENLIGFFINTLVLRVDLSGRPGFTEVLQRIKKVTLEAYAHQAIPFEKLVEVLSPERNLGSTPLFQVMLVMQNTPQRDLRLGAARLQGFDTGDNGTAKFDLLLALGENDSGGLAGSLQYSADIFEAMTMRRMAGHFHGLLSGLVSRPDQSIFEPPLLTAEERKQIVEEWNGARYEIPEQTLVELFEEQVQRTPGSEAVVFGGERTSYEKLNQRANQLAHALRGHGVGPESAVGVCLERSAEMVMALLAVLKAGGMYVPLDAGYPGERLRWMLEDIQPAVLITQTSVEAQLPPFPGKVIRLDADGKELSRNSEANVVCEINGQNLAYVIYTSGSTGRPKGVGITHASAVTLMHWAREVFSAEELSGVLASTSICFDLSVYEVFVPLCWGGKVIVSGNALELPDLAAREEVKLVNTVPSAMQELVRSGRVPRSVVTVNLAGEALTASLVKQVYGMGNVRRLLNLYGPSEDTTYSTFTWLKREEFEEKEQVTIGKPVWNTQAYVVDELLGPVPQGVPGELYMGGAGVARGYLNRPEITAERFVPNPFVSQNAGGERMYRTGDLVRWLPDGNLEYLGRLDHQVKIRGFRIELGEIESTLQEHESVRQAVVMVREDKPGDKRLVAYVVMEPEAEESQAGAWMIRLQEHLQKKLPNYMVPSLYVEMQDMPLTQNGKIDRKKLPSPETEVVQQEYVGPRNPTEETLCRIWQEVLRRERVGIHDNFFALGGHSLLAAQLVTRIRDSFKVEISIRALFEAPTAGKMTKYIAGENGQQSPSPVLVSMQPQGTSTPLFFVHAVDGQVMSYAELSRELGLEQPFYGLQSPSAEFFPDSDAGITQMATLYIREMRTVQPHGPYLLGGWSMGGLVAWEMAQQLAKQGETVKLLALIDTAPPSGYREESNKTDEPSMLARFAMNVSRLVGKDPRPLAEKFLRLTPQDQWMMVEETLTSYGVLSPATAHVEMTALLNVFTRNFLAMNNYIASPGNQQVVFFRASETPEHLAEPWTTLAGGGIQFHSVPGDHVTILTQPTVRIIANLLQESISSLGGQLLQVSAVGAATTL
jgi:amino acid adenylation domain-containing protein